MAASELWFFSPSIWNKQETWRTQSERLNPPLRCWLKNHSVKRETKIICTLETDLTKLLESKVEVVNAAATDARIVWHNVQFIQYEQFRLNYIFRQYLGTSSLSKKFFQMVVKKTALQKSYEIAVGVQSYTIDFVAKSRQFGWLEISLVYDKSNKYEAI